jgi:hypothetical protein
MIVAGVDDLRIEEPGCPGLSMSTAEIRLGAK